MTISTQLNDLERALNYLRPSNDPNWQYFRNNLYVERADEAIEILEEILQELEKNPDDALLERAKNILTEYKELEKIFKKTIGVDSILSIQSIRKIIEYKR